jgi:hypothetical protein
VSRKDWDAEVQGDRRRILGDAEGYCIRSSILMGLKWAAARECECDPDLAMTFDNRPGRMGEIQSVFNAIKEGNEAAAAVRKLNLLAPYTADLMPIAFGASTQCYPLQAADLFAWEFYQNVKDALAGHGDIPRRDQMKELIGKSRGQLVGVISTREEIANIQDVHGTDEQMAQLVKHMPKSWNWKVK